MAKKRRTKKQKQASTVSYSLSQVNQTADTTSTVKKSNKKGVSRTDSLFAYDPAFIMQDLRKTLLVSGVILALELVIYFYLPR